MKVKWDGGQDGANLGQGVSFQVAEILPTGVKRGDWTCAGNPCEGYTFHDNGDSCVYPVQPGTEQGKLEVYGRVVCSAPPEVCEQFRSKLKLRKVDVTETVTPSPSQSPSPSETPTPTPSVGPTPPVAPQSAGPDVQPSPTE